MTVRNIAIVLALVNALPSIAAADEQEGPWSGKATLGFLATSGNTENSTLNTGVQIGYSVGKWLHLAESSAITSTEEENTTAEVYVLGWKSERNLSEQGFIFGRLRWRKDRFSGYDTQFSQSVGYGRRLLATEAHELNAEVGAGARQSDLVDGTEEEEVIVRGALNYTWQFNDTAELRQDVAVESGAENTYFESVTAVSAELFGDLSLVASYTIKKNSDVPVDTERTDTYTALSLEYAF